MADAKPPARPSWQTDELEEEWIDEDDETEANEPPATIQPDAHTTSDISFTEPLNSHIATGDGNETRGNRSSDSAGTVVVHSDAEEEGPILLHTPGAKKIMSKDLFSPLPLERMFDPPSATHEPPPLPPPRTTAPAIPSRLSQVYVPGENDTSSEWDMDADGSMQDSPSSRKSLARSQPQPETNFKFTFAAPPPGPFSRAASSQPNAQSTPYPRSRLCAPQLIRCHLL